MGAAAVTSREFKERLITARTARRRAGVAGAGWSAGAVLPAARPLESKINLTGLPLVAARGRDVRPAAGRTARCRAGSCRSATSSASTSARAAVHPRYRLRWRVRRLMMRMVESKTRKAVFLTEAVAPSAAAARERGDGAIRSSCSPVPICTRAPTCHRPCRARRGANADDAAGFPEADRGSCSGSGAPSVRRSPSNVPPPLRWTATHPLVDANSSRLVVLSKDLVASRSECSTWNRLRLGVLSKRRRHGDFFVYRESTDAFPQRCGRRDCSTQMLTRRIRTAMLRPGPARIIRYLGYTANVSQVVHPMRFTA